jgi:hypothetical protein
MIIRKTGPFNRNSALVLKEALIYSIENAPTTLA